MKKQIAFTLLAAAFAGCGSDLKNGPSETEAKNTVSEIDTTPRVTGIGGVFFFSENPSDAKDWYEENLGFEMNEWGASFEFRNANHPEETNYLAWSLFKEGSEYFAPSKKPFMINYRVQNLEGLLRKLRENGVEVTGEMETHGYGKFAHIIDSEGNKIELWEPIDSVLTQMGGKTIK